MTFDGIDLCPSPWPGVLLTAAAWCFPTIVFVLQRQQAPGRLKRQLTGAQWTLAVGATLYTVVSTHLFDPRTPELVGLVFVCLGPALFLAALAAVLMDFVHKRRSGVA
jgi:hypothetical protein